MPSSLAPSPCSPASLALVPRLGTEFLPELNEGVDLGQLHAAARHLRHRNVAAAGADPSRRSASSRKSSSVISKAGRPEDGTDPKLINMAEFLVDVKPADRVAAAASAKEQLDRSDEHARSQTIPGIEPSFSQPIRDNVLESISQIDGQIVIKVFGDDIDVLRRARQRRASTRSAPVRGVARAFVDRGGQVPQLQIEIDRARAARYGLNVADVEDVIETALGGKTATEIWEGERRFSVVVRLSEEERRDRGARSRTSWSTRRAGCAFRSRRWRRIAVGSGSMNISRESGTRVAAIGVFIHGRDMGSIVSEMQQRVRANVHAAARLLHRLGRRVREPAARHGAAAPDRADQHPADLRAAVQRVRIGEERGADSAQRAVRADRRNPGAVPDRHPPERLGGHRLHRAVRPGGAERRGDGELFQPAAAHGRRRVPTPPSKARSSASARC